MGFLNISTSLKERASAQFAINLCQQNSFKEVALCLGKPIYGLYMCEKSFSPFISDPIMLSLWKKINEPHNTRENVSSRNFKKSFYKVFNEANQWDVAVDEQCQKLTVWLPSSLKHGVSFWIKRIALEYLSYSRRQEYLFDISRYFLMDIFSQQDWTEDCRLDEEKLAKRLIQDERLSVYQRFRVACFYCLYLSMPALWMRLTFEEKQSLVGSSNSHHLPEKNPLVLIGSRYMDAHQNENVIEPQNNLWAYAAREATCHGNRAIVRFCWKRLKEPVKRQLVFDLAFESLRLWQKIRVDKWKKKYFTNVVFHMQIESISHFTLPSYYSELVRFFLFEMSEVEQMEFFQKVFQKKSGDYALECFLDWTHHGDFLSTIQRLWGIMPKDKYWHCFLAVAKKYSGDCVRTHPSILLYNESHYFDYQSLLWKLWEDTPEEFKRYLFSSQESQLPRLLKNLKSDLFHHLLSKSPFQENDEALFRQIWRDLLPEEKTALFHSDTGKVICSRCITNEKWCFLNRLIENCLPKEEIPVFKKKFISSFSGRILCLHKLKNREKLLEDLMISSKELYYEKYIFGCEFIDKKEYLDAFELTLNENQLTDRYCLIHSSLLPDNNEEFTLNFIKYACCTLLKDCAWKQMSNLLAWSFNTEEEIRDIKRYLFSCKGTDIHYTLVFVLRQWEDVECFYKWFCLSPEEIINIKKETAMTPKVIKDIHKSLYQDTDALVESLRWCLTDGEMVINLKEKVEEHFKQTLDKEEEKAKERLDCLVKQLLCDCKMKFDTKYALIESKGEKRSLAIKDESRFSNKLFKKSL